MKNMIICSIIFLSITCARAQKIEYNPLPFYGKHVSEIQFPGKQIHHKDGSTEVTVKKAITPVTSSSLPIFLAEAKKKGFKVKYDVPQDDEYFLAYDATFIVLTKGNSAIALFNKNDTSYILTKHRFLPEAKWPYKEDTYARLFGQPWRLHDSEKAPSLAAIKQKTSGNILLLNKESLQKVIKQL